eukprot:TRINITY_DN2327_c0_g1_i2.p1 TRINITY_DN2327_c0_g1~~TRINITY_DN2327_c0_g1_i2.p1  ORF type:complete len:182 (-),score=21.93 TRINITY_DN2327_c0_g1_i2:632-1177(-)
MKLASSLTCPEAAWSAHVFHRENSEEIYEETQMAHWKIMKMKEKSLLADYGSSDDEVMLMLEVPPLDAQQPSRRRWRLRCSGGAHTAGGGAAPHGCAAQRARLHPPPPLRTISGQDFVRKTRHALTHASKTVATAASVNPVDASARSKVYLPCPPLHLLLRMRLCCLLCWYCTSRQADQND